ncbi:hypothetical protein Tco_1018579 [Tanacetum coccineum]|uniref:Reverse transcriptase Ty1/copia-type domain-containing protein n=1 Tax=Tanacetum coccineum TaxID=301880 RepID=A0ABQ5FVU0_9ASTR
MIHQQKIPPYQKKIWIICGLMYKEYFEKISFEVSINSATRTTLHNQDTPLSYSIIVEHNEDPPLVSSSEEQISLISNDEADELIQEEDYADLDGNMLLSLYHTRMFDKAESSSIAKDPSNMPVMTSRLITDSEVCMYALTEECINFKESSTPVARFESVRMFVAHAAHNGPLKEEVYFFLGLQVHQSLHSIFISQSQYAIELLKKHEMDECDFMITPMANARLEADLQGTPTDQTRYHRGLQFLGEKLVSWSSKKQDCTALSTAKAEYVSLSACCAQVIWMRTQLLKYGYKFNKIPMYCDLKRAIAISCNPV